MKKILIIFLSFVLIINMAGCGNKESSDTAKSEFEIKSAQVLTENYLKYISRKDEQNAKSLLDKSLANNVYFDKNLSVWGYNFDEITQVGDTGMLKLFILKGSPDKAYSLLEKYDFKVEKKDGEYKITEILKKPEKEIFVSKNSLRVKNQDQIETKLLLEKGSIPKYVSSKDNKSGTYNMEVSSVNFGPAAVSYTGDKAVVSTYNSGNCYLGLTTIEDIKAASSAGGEEGSGEEQGDKQTDGQNQGIEKPVGEKITNLDYLLASKITNISFTPEEKFVIIGYKGSKGSQLRIYYSASGELIPAKIEDEFSGDKYNVTYAFSDKKYIYFSVSTIKGEQDAKTGSYRMKMEDFKIDRI